MADVKRMGKMVYLELQPQAMLFAVTEARAVISVGLAVVVVLPRPSRPLAPLPNARSLPASSRSSVCIPPQAICLILRDASPATARGTEHSCTVP